MAVGLATTGGDTRLVLERDETLVRHDQQRLIEAIRGHGLADRLRYDHLSAHAEPVLALPDVVAWCWVRSGLWRRRIEPIVRAVRTI